jgi:hypothetical protein
VLIFNIKVDLADGQKMVCVGRLDPGYIRIVQKSLDPGYIRLVQESVDPGYIRLVQESVDPADGQLV